MLTRNREHVYRECPDLHTPGNNLLVLLTWAPSFNGPASRMLNDWARSENGLHFSQRLIENFKKRQMPAQLALILIAFLSFERLLDNPPTDSVLPAGSSYLDDLHAILQGQVPAGRRNVLERIAFAFLRVLWKAGGYGRLAETIDIVLDMDWPQLDYLDGLSDQYVVKRLHKELCHQDAFDEVTRVLRRRVCVDGNSSAAHDTAVH